MLRMQFVPKSSSGRIVITAKAAQQLSDDDITSAMRRHLRGDHNAHAKREQERCLLDGCRLLSAFHTAAGVGFWVITEADRSVTLLLPEDYGA
jgi:hypothetical protein